MIKDFTDCYRILELAPSSTQEEVKCSYRELVKVWHPDRFSGDPKLQKKAEEKLKQINLAYEWICKGEAGGSRRRSAHAETNASQAGAQSRPSGSSNSTNNQGEPRAEAPRQPTHASTTNWGRRIVQFAITVVIITVIKAVFSTSDRPRPQMADYAPSYNQPSQSYPPPNSQPATVPPQVTSSPLLEQPAAHSKVESPADGTVAFSKPTEESTKKVEMALAKDRDPSSLASSSPTRNFFTVGSTKQDVLAIQGTPDRFTDTSFAYGTSDVFFESGRVKSWDNRFPKLKVTLLPRAQADNKGYFSAGSTKDEVLAVQGTPDRFTDMSFAYGTSDVFFENGRVKSWDNRFPKLKVQLLPTSQTATKSYFTIDSTKDEVLAIQGTPDRFTDTSFAYGTSDVFFENGRVKSWDNRFPKLKAELLPNAQAESRGYFTVGSTKDEVLAVQGTPDRFTDATFSYGTSDVFFEKGRVKSWDDRYPKLKARLLTEPQTSK